MSQTFKRTIENFTCGHCGVKVAGNGYTNHCPVCLWSRHVDVHPGDRAAKCRGMMGPVGLTIRARQNIITHRCIVCGYTKNNRAVRQDNDDTLIELSTKPR